ncbi:DUF3426 domain-containing protein [Collinsella tanakaei]|uniref:FxLYD domain-containing protein n=1 Tax=Collinsella tanakaei TaxID=626935 RepID=UPI0019595AED|nr:FxLYD domain-containing protein [Collinsella tanakaei]MBM6757012.1 DUF3426 domain-containing protein [Collinsella tanakaei]
MAKEGKKPIGKIVLIIVIVLIVAGAAGAMGGGTDASDGGSQQATSGQQEAASEPESEPEPEPEPYAIADEALNTENPYAATITGMLTNNTDSDKKYIQVEYVLYDADGAQIGTALANTNNLKAGGSWKFEAFSTVAPDEVASFERADVTGF